MTIESIALSAVCNPYRHNSGHVTDIRRATPDSVSDAQLKRALARLTHKALLTHEFTGFYIATRTGLEAHHATH